MKQSAAKKKVEAVGLSPPWVTQYNKLANTVGSDPLVKVGPLLTSKSGYFTRLRVTGNLKARALATLLTPSVKFGNVTFQVIVLNQDGVRVSPFTGPFTARRIVRLFTLALQSNRLFQFAAIRRAVGTSTVYPVFAKQVVQFYNDDLSDYYQNFNGVAAFVFRDVMVQSLGGIAIDYSTFAPKSRQ